jgi:hypothetical protein
MTRVNLGGGQWFDKDKAQCYGDDTRWDGHNHISVATGSQWHRQDLYHTASGTWILCSHSAYKCEYEFLTTDAAYEWLIDNNHHSAVPEPVLSEKEV